MSSDSPHFTVAQKEGNVHYSADVIDDVNDDLHGHLVLSETPTTQDDYRYVPFELPVTHDESAGPEVDGTVPLGDSDAVLTGHTSSCAISTASEPPDVADESSGPFGGPHPSP